MWEENPVAIVRSLKNKTRLQTINALAQFSTLHTTIQAHELSGESLKP
jgi:hypothetical protein